MSTLLKLAVPIPTLDVKVSDTESFGVVGLTPTGAWGLYNRHTGALSDVFDRMVADYKAQGTIETGDVQTVIAGLLKDFPLLMADVVALGSGGSLDEADIDEFEKARDIAIRLPFPVQVDALTKIGQLTFTSDMPPGKFLALVISLIQAGTGALAKMSTLSNEG